ncbi:Uncharacterized protein HZ326_19574 [Fusarium oxysporum f. sp. albedinis]|nr:Uncharacterized protein HZ326_19574 [Fusarium oxysporum f. sp. albedinis]KAK2468262.1 hypothetical protein H9L39_19908 [Fusarium oxysporum f. sp. albedinis]
MSDSESVESQDESQFKCQGAQWKEPKKWKEVDEEKRMKNYVSLMSITSWDEARTTLTGIGDTFHFALAINDMPELYRFKAVSLLNFGLDIAVGEIITMIQCNRIKYDPKSMFPIVVTDGFLDTLPKQAYSCYICYQLFHNYENIIWKSCGKHAMHSYCLRDLLQANELPLVGPCECIKSSCGPWPMPTSETRKKRSMILHHGWNLRGKLLRPRYPTRVVE